ncbi:MAG TPA: HD domain-containing phosphohydrolase [Burkholderiaceae bacterium]|nr:HD domain-containing phosphohydrolase [Burkholderiaceae bacterium]
MEESLPQFIDINLLRKGMFVQLDLGWMDHPFPKGSFKISSNDQIQTIRSLGLAQVRYFPGKSDPIPAEGDGASATAADGTAEPGGPEAAQPVPQALSPEAVQRKLRAEQLGAQQRSLMACERRFGEATRQYRKVVEHAIASPEKAREHSMTLINGCVSELIADGESAIRLLSEGMGDRNAMHPVNVMVVSLLLGKALGLSAQELTDLGQAALLHDLGKLQLPDRVRLVDEHFTAAEYKLYQDHVTQGITIGKRMGLSPSVLVAMAQHHELVDGSGFPLHLKEERLGTAGKILALINRYDNLCNPPKATLALTPHEALSVIFAQMKSRFDAVVLGAFIRMMGVYPPGSVVQLVNDRFAIVVSVNSARPLRPRVIVHDPSVPKNEALILDLEHHPQLGIRRSLKPTQLPKAALDYLSPRQRVCYFFERAIDPEMAGAPT